MNGKTLTVCFALFFVFISSAFPTIYTVINTNDAGPGSLRDAIGQANTNIGADTIHFNTGLPGVKRIVLTTGIMNVRDTLFIDGSSDPAYVGLPVIEVDGNVIHRALFYANTAPYSRIHALAIINSDFIALQSLADHFTLTGSHIGVDASGTVEVPNDFMGVGIYASSHVKIGGIGPNEGNVIAGNDNIGLGIYNSDSSFVIGNKIGNDISGSIVLANGQGIGVFNSSEITIGGNTPDHRNLISGNGIGIQFYISNNCHVKGNYIGTDVSGTIALPNTSSAIYARGDSNIIGGILAGEGNLISGNSNIAINFFSGAQQGDSTFGNKVFGNLIGTNVNGNLALPNRTGIMVGNGVRRTEIGGTTAAHRNIISGNTSHGILISWGDSTVILGNFIGTDINGTAALGNQGNGIDMGNASRVYIGNASLIGANVISGNNQQGIGITSTSGINYIQHNFIGTDLSGMAYLPNTQNGIFIRSTATQVQIGGVNANEGNFIANNLSSGIVVNGPAALSNQILGNSIYDHPNPGILLSGGNNNQEAPDITGYSTGPTTTINGTFTSAPNTTYRLEFFSSPTSAQGKTFLGFSNITTDATGFYALNETFPLAITATEPIITATATDPNGNTSAFGQEAVLEVDWANGSLSSEEELSIIHPNPIKPSSEIRIELREDRFLQVRLISIDGKEVLSLYDDLMHEHSALTLSCESFEKLSPGVYILQIKGETFQRSRKVILE